MMLSARAKNVKYPTAAQKPLILKETRFDGKFDVGRLATDHKVRHSRAH